MAGAGLTKVEGERRVGAVSAESADRMGAEMRAGYGSGWRCECRGGDVMLEGARVVALDDWGGGRSRG